MKQVQKQILKGDGSHLDNRFKLFSKFEKDVKPTEKELESAYGYLDYCLECGKQLRFLEPYQHSMFGNCHRFGCSKLKRILGLIYNITILTFIKIPLLIIILPFYLFYSIFNKEARRELFG